MPTEAQERVYKQLQRLPGDGLAAAKQLFWTELNYDRVNAPLSRRHWPERATGVLADDPLILAHHESQFGGFDIIHAQLAPSQVGRGFPLSLTAERLVINQLLPDHPYALFVFSDAEERHWHLVNVRYDKEGARRQVFRRIAIGPHERLRTASERVAMLDLESMDRDLFGLSPLAIQQRHDQAFNVEAVTQQFFGEYQRVFAELQAELHRHARDTEWAHDFSLQFLNRLMFLYYVQRKRWLGDDPDFVSNFWHAYQQAGRPTDTFFSEWLSMLFFEAFNKLFQAGRADRQYLPEAIRDALALAPYLNGGLFVPNELDRRHKPQISDARLARILAFLDGYNFTISEDTPLDQEVAVDPEMIGKVYESLVNVSEEVDERGAAGIFYTPRVEIDLMCRLSLVHWLVNQLGEEHKRLLYEVVFAFDPEDKERADAALANFNLWPRLYELLCNLIALDPACGSGSFLVGMLYVLDDLMARANHQLGYEQTPYERKKRIIGQNLYGVDVMDWAVHVAELRLWLQLVIDTDLEPAELQFRPLLPNLSFKVRGLLRVILEHPDVDRVAELGGFRDALLPLEQTLAGWCEACRLRLAEMYEGTSDYDPDTPVLFSTADFWIPSLYRPAHTLLGQLQALSLAAEALLEKLPYLRGMPRRLPGSLGTLHQHIEENAEALSALLSPDAQDQIRWGEAQVRLDEQGVPCISGNVAEWRAVFHSSPLDVATWLRQILHPLYAYRIYVSATLAVGGSFSSILNRLGLLDGAQAPEPVTKICPSPFNFREQVLLAVPSDAPDPRTSTDPLYLEMLSTNIADLAREAGGQTLVLFTSRRTMRQLAPRLQARFRDEQIVILAQSATNRAALVERFRAAPQQGEKLVLLGLRAFWEGIDVPGEALTILVVSRLPFDYAGHPIAVARRQYYLSQGFDRDYFREVVVPATFLHLRQMYGRLIRKEDDRGICVVMDPRIYLKRYGKYLLKRLPESARVVAPSPVVLDHARQFLRGEPAPSDLFDWGELPYIAHDLSPEQRAIVQSPDQRILVRAAAGSGKTYVLVERLMGLVESGKARPDEVLALTFTNKAMNVMIDRLCDRLGDRGYDLARNVLTYHKFAARILRQDAWEAGQEVVFLDENNPELQSGLLDQARKVAGLTERDLSDEDALTVVAYAQNGLVNEEELEQVLPELQRHDPFTARLGQFFLSYVGQLRAHGLMDYGEAIVGAVRILRTDAQAKQTWSGRYKWIFCDEYQDTTPAQATLLSLIGQHAHLFVVGDSAQSIYSWQGADPDNLRRFEIDFPNTATYQLYKNYRCFPNLIRVSSRFLERCGQAHGIRITYDERRSTENQSVYYLSSQDDQEEAGAIAALASDALALEIPGDPPRTGTVGVLARKWWLLSSLEIELIRQEVPYRFEGDTARGLSARPDVRRVIDRAVDLLRLATSDQPMGDSPDGRAVADVRAGHLASADRLLDRALQVLGSVLSAEARADYGQLRAALKDKPVEVLTKLYGGGPDQPTVVLSTVHSQKGEEFDTVFVLGLEKGNSPHTPPVRHAQIVEWRRVVQRLSHATWRAPLTDEELEQLYDEEEQRIFYVAMTRARHNLVIGHAARRNKRPFAQSQFLERARIEDAVREVAGAYEITLTRPEAPTSVSDYRSDGRLYETNAGVRVRSKSEMLLANEFTRRGMYFEYEEPAEGVPYALPDFTFPDYGGVVLEHLGLLTDADYLARWEAKAAEYERRGVRYFRTNEEEIQRLAATVDRLQRQFRDWAEQHYGAARLRLIDLVERVRREGDLLIGRSIGEFENGVFEAASTSDVAVVATVVTLDFENSPIPREPSEAILALGHNIVKWERQPVVGTHVWVGRTT
jgi:superfamily I DNA/RNA helicase